MSDAVPAWFYRVGAPLVLAVDDAASVMALNGEAERLFGSSVAAQLPCPLAALIGVHAAASVLGVVGTERDLHFQNLSCHIAGQERWLDIALSELEDGRQLLTLRDRTAEHDSASQLSAMEQDIRDIMEAMPVGVEIYDRDDQCLFMNAYGAGLLGYEIEDVVRLDDWWRLAYPDPGYRQVAIDAWAREVRNAREIKGYVNMADWIVASKDGTRKLIHFRLRSLGDKIVLAYWDVTDHGRLVTRLRELADTDPLTGVSNRRRFLEEAQGMVKSVQKDESALALLMIDIDYFKTVNDRYGHAVGDLVLRDVVEKCRRTLREQDLLARLGGEEFAALMRAGNPAEAFRMAEALCSYIAAAPMLVEGMLVQVTVSIGFAVLDTADSDMDPGDGPDAPAEALSALMRRADRALYAAKHGGRNRVVWDGLTFQPGYSPAQPAEDGPH